MFFFSFLFSLFSFLFFFMFSRCHIDSSLEGETKDHGSKGFWKSFSGCTMYFVVLGWCKVGTLGEIW